jgi:glycosyltransferase involved in cell wall biosynthesis
VSNFSEIIICDGGSTDATLEIATKHGAKIIKQSSEFLDESGKLIDYSGPRNQMLKEVKNDWQFHLDSDEALTQNLVDEIRSIVNKGSNADNFVYLVRRKYVFKGKIIDRSISYPSFQYRFFNRLHVTQFTKKIHERIRFNDSEPIGKTKNFQLVPLDMTVEEMWNGKYKKYIAMEVDLYKERTLFNKIKSLLNMSKRLGSLFARLFTRRIFRSGTKLPADYDLLVIKYQWVLLIGFLRNVM